MITRLVVSTSSGMFVALGLIYLMHLLIVGGEEILVEPRKRWDLDWILLTEKRDSPVEQQTPTRPVKPPMPPTTRPPEQSNNGETGIGVAFVPPPPVPGGRDTISFSTNDGPLINIIKVQPQYPAEATRRGLEGTVIVQFDVTAMGTVENVVVVESSHSIFNRAARDAAYRFKYKPMMVDGVPYGATGLQAQFRFELEK